MEQNAKKKISCGGFMLGEGLVLSEDGKTLSVSGGGGGGSADAVLYTPQTLTDAQKKQARDNIDAGSKFVVTGTLTTNQELTLDKTFAQIREAIDTGKIPVLVAFGNYFSVVSSDEECITFEVVFGEKGGSTIYTVYVYSNQDPQLEQISLLGLNGKGALPQASMASDPTKDMQIATKKYVDNKECVLKSSTPGSTKKFRITVDDSGTLKATEI